MSIVSSLERRSPDRLRYLPGVTTLAFDVSRCDGCLMCTHVCPHAVFAPRKGTVEMVDGDACMECGACARNCPRGAITVRAGVGCAWAVLFNRRGRTSAECCCDTTQAACGDQ